MQRIQFTAARAGWVTKAAETAAFDNGQSIIVTLEPTPLEKDALAIDGGETPEQLHLTLAYLIAKVADLTPEDRLAISAVLAKFGAETGPITASVGGVGWFGEQDSITLALIDSYGLAAFRTALANALAEAGFPLSNDHDFIPHITLAWGAVDAQAKVGQPLTFNELRLRWGNDAPLAFDLLGIPQAPVSPTVQSPEVAPAAPPAPIEAATPTQEAPVADYETVEDHPACQGSPDGSVAVVDASGSLISCHVDVAAAQAKVDELNVEQGVETPLAPPSALPPPPAGVARVREDVAKAIAARRAANLSTFDLDAADEILLEDTSMAGDLTSLSDDEITAELARRIADKAAADADPATADAVQAAALAEVTEAMADALADLQEIAAGGAIEEDEAGASGIANPSEMPYSARIDIETNRLAARVDRWKLHADSIRAVTALVAAGGATAPAEMIPTDPNALKKYEAESVLTVEGSSSGDGRFIAEGCLTWRDLPLPFMLQTVNAPGHDGAEFCGWIGEIERVGNSLVGRIDFAATPAGEMARTILSDPASANKFGVSVDIDSVRTVFASPDGAQLTEEQALEAQFGGGEIVEMMVSGRIMGATMTPFPAFQEAYVYLLGPLDEPSEALVAAAGRTGDVWRATIPMSFSFGGGTPTEALVASAAGPDPDAPPLAWFQQRPMDDPEPFTVHPDGRCYGLVAQWGTCHIGNSRRCTSVPRSNDFRSFYTGKKVLTREGEMVAVGPVIMDTVHPNLLWDASDAQAFYAHTGCAVADVRLYTNEHGIVAAGAIRPGASPTQVRRLRASDISPDWRPISGEHKLVSLLAVNTSGFLVEGIAASAGNFRPYGVYDSVTGDVGALVAAGAIRRDRDEFTYVNEVEALRAEMTELRATVAILASHHVGAQRAARAKAALAVLGMDTDCGCSETLADDDDSAPGGGRFVDDGDGLLISAPSS